MKYEVKISYVTETGDGKQKKTKSSLLIEDECVIGASTEAEKYIAELYSEGEVEGVSKSSIREECNPMYYASHYEPTAWTITLEQTYMLYNGKQKKMRYPVLLWSDELPNEKEGELKIYLEQIRMDDSEFSVVKITKSPVEACINC